MVPAGVTAARGPTSLAGSRLGTILLVLHILLWITIPMALLWSGRQPSGDLARFVELHHETGTPYRAFQVEYPPLHLLLVRAIFVSDGVALAVAGLLNAGATVCSYVLLRHGWTQAVATTFLLGSLPLQLLLPIRIDAVSVALAVGAVYLGRRGSFRSSALTLAAGVMFRIWPAVIAPATIVRHRASSILWPVALTAGAFVAWIAWSGIGAVGQVATYRGATGWHVESTVGVVVSISTSATTVMEQGTSRVGDVLAWQRLVSLLVLGGLLSAIWMKAMRRDVDPAGMPSLAAVSALLACSPLFSPQFVAWLLPWAAIAIIERRRRLVTAVVLTSCVSAAFFMVLLWTTRPLALLEAFALVRVACVWLIVGCWLAERRRGAEGG